MCLREKNKAGKVAKEGVVKAGLAKRCYLSKDSSQGEPTGLGEEEWPRWRKWQGTGRIALSVEGVQQWREGRG